MRSSFLISPKNPTKNYKDPGDCRQFFGNDPCLFGRAEILVIFGWRFGRNDDFINSF
jgi:hypothetical protein